MGVDMQEITETNAYYVSLQTTLVLNAIFNQFNESIL